MITIYGASDDLIEVEGCVNADEINHYGSGPWSAVLRCGDESMKVHAWFTREGQWAVGVSQDGLAPGAEEGNGLPWPITIRQGTDAECCYSAVLLVDAPEGTELILPEGDDDE